MIKKTEKIAEQLLSRIYTAQVLKSVSDALEELAQDKTFTRHANDIIADANLTKKQKQTQLSYLIRAVEIPLLYDFFSDIIADGGGWIFRADDLKYFDEFIQSFQLLTESCEVLTITTAIELSDLELVDIGKDASKTLGYRVVVNHTVNPGIIGGLQARMGNSIYDLSLRYKFRQFQKEWIQTLEQTSKHLNRHEAVEVNQE